jgi:hypothetical protein
MWRMSYQDFRGWRTTDFKQAYPEVKFEDFSDKQSADQAKSRAILDGFTACVAPTPTGRLRAKRPTTVDDISGTSPKRFNANWKLAR